MMTTQNIYSLERYEIFLDEAHYPINCDVFSGDIDEVSKELKYNNKGYHLQLRPENLYILFGDLDHIKSEEEFQNILFYLCENLDVQSHSIAYTKSNKGQELSYHFRSHLYI